MDTNDLVALEHARKDLFKAVTQNVELIMYLVAEFGHPLMLVGYRSPDQEPPKYTTDFNIIKKRGPNLLIFRWHFHNVEVQLQPMFATTETFVVGLKGDEAGKARAEYKIAWLNQHRTNMLKGGKNA